MDIYPLKDCNSGKIPVTAKPDSIPPVKELEYDGLTDVIKTCFKMV